MASLSKNKIITMNRADTFKFPFYIAIGSTVNYILYDMVPGDKLYFAVLEPHQKWEDALIKKTYTYKDYETENHRVMIRFVPEDTEYVKPGNYYYQVKLYRPSENVLDGYEAIDTLIPRTKFIILE